MLITFAAAQSPAGQTEIMKWEDGKNGAVSITYDDGSINQFLKAVPIMNTLGLPGTFFINTGSLPGSEYQGKFIGRPVKDIITHPYMAALDEPNLMYELEKSREEILNHIGAKYTFSAECPYGTEDERAMEYAHKVYPALRNRMPEKFLIELNRSSRETPVNQKMEYVQWQRGATTKTPLPMMKAWVDTTAGQKNIWLVLVIHGVDGIGWEALTSQSIDEYFRYMKSKDSSLWFATFGNVARYMRERMNAEVKSSLNGGKISVTLKHSLDRSMYDLPLTLKTVVKPEWKEVVVRQGAESKIITTYKAGNVTFVQYQAMPNAGNIEITGK